jgi:hypothetical protein
MFVLLELAEIVVQCKILIGSLLDSLPFNMLLCQSKIHSLKGQRWEIVNNIYELMKYLCQNYVINYDKSKRESSSRRFLRGIEKEAEYEKQGVLFGTPGK